MLSDIESSLFYWVSPRGRHSWFGSSSHFPMRHQNHTILRVLNRYGSHYLRPACYLRPKRNDHLHM